MDANQLLQMIAGSVKSLNDKFDDMQRDLSQYQLGQEKRLTTVENGLGEVVRKVANIKPTAFKSGSNGTSQAVTLNLSKSLVIVLAIVLLLLGGAGKEILGFIFGGG
jgi:TolA-binding protein